MGSVLITGAARRIGAEIASALAGEGWHVCLHYHRSTEEAKRLRNAIVASNGLVDLVQADLSSPAELERLVGASTQAAAKRGRPLTALINNASLFEYDQLSTLSTESWAAHLDVNLRAPILLAQHFARQLTPTAQGCIINMLDNKVFALNPDFFSYTVSKLGLHAATEAMAMALAPHVRVCGIAPGLTLQSGAQTSEDFVRTHDRNPLKRGCSPADIVRAVRFILATPAYTGHTITIDGGHALLDMSRDIAFADDDVSN